MFNDSLEFCGYYRNLNNKIMKFQIILYFEIYVNFKYNVYIIMQVCSINRHITNNVDMCCRYSFSNVNEKNKWTLL